MTDRELLTQALEALEKIIPDDSGHWPMQDTTVTALRERLAQQDSWHEPDCEGDCIACHIEGVVQDVYGKEELNYLRHHVTIPPEQKPVAWNVINPAGEVVATEKDSIHGWARLGGFKPTVEGLLGFHDQGWRVVPSTTPLRREWQGLTDEEIKALPQWYPSHEAAAVMPLIRAIEAKLKEKNG